MKIYLVSILSFWVSSCFCQVITKQIRISLNNVTGVPYYLGDMQIYSINGFEIDSAENFYFMAGDRQKGTTTLAVFNSDKQKYRKVYATYFANNIILHANRIYLLDRIKNDFYTLDTKDGKILKKQNHIIENNINSYYYIDSLIVLWTIGNAEQRAEDSISFITLLNLKGEIIGKAKNKNLYNIPDSLYLKQLKTFGGQYLGRWNGFLLFWDDELIKPGPNGLGYYKFYFEDTRGKIIGVSTFDDKIFGRLFLSPDNSTRKLRNGNIYIVDKDGPNKNVLITILSVDELYKDALQHPDSGIKNEH